MARRVNRIAVSTAWSFPLRLLLGSVLLACSASPTGAQAPDTATSRGHLGSLVTLGSLREDRLRVDQVVGRASADGFLIRSPSTLSAAPPVDSGVRWALLVPEVRAAWNGELPLSLNDGALWAGRGVSTSVTAGVRAAVGPLSLVLAPQLVYAENRAFQIVPSTLDGRSAFSYPWRVDTQSIDLPMRFGNEALVMLDPGQSTLALTGRGAAIGASTENQWWGPGVRNALVMSSNAPGVPHLFLRTASPVHTAVGSWEGKWIAGAMVESLYFDSLAANDVRPLSAFVLTYRPAGSDGLTLGLARAVYSTGGSAGEALAHAADVFTHWDAAPAADTIATESEQILSLFGRWLFPADGFEIYGEWARLRLPGSLRDFLTAPHHTQGYTLGLQWARPSGAGLVRLAGELSYLEKSATVKQRAVNTFYASRGVPHGYTHRGQVVGAAIGPGSSSQWFAGDFLAPRWQAGLFLGRIRWNSDFLYDTPSPAPGRLIRSAYAFDVSVMGGVRAARSIGRYRLGADLTLERRLNYLFQNPDLDFTSPGAVSVTNPSLDLFVEALR